MNSTCNYVQLIQCKPDKKQSAYSISEVFKHYLNLPSISGARINRQDRVAIRYMLHLNKRSCIVTNLIGIQWFTRELIVSRHGMARGLTKNRIEGTSVSGMQRWMKAQTGRRYFFFLSPSLSLSCRGNTCSLDLSLSPPPFSFFPSGAISFHSHVSTLRLFNGCEFRLHASSCSVDAFADILLDNCYRKYNILANWAFSRKYRWYMLRQARRARRDTCSFARSLVVTYKNGD